MAEVWAAHDTVLDREVAIKLLLDRFRADEGFTRRFQDEARHVARLNHPNLVAVYDTGREADQPFIVMELVAGRSLQEAIDAGGLTEDRALEVCADVCSALHYAHERGLIHRDIKPGNILLAEDGTVKVTDFGIARAVGNETVTRTAAVLGTAAYLSPEQAQGLEVDARSDLYSLGVVLYESLTGRQPFVGDSAVTVAYQHVQEPPRPPREWEPSVSTGAEAITMRALAKNPANRYQHADEMREDLLNARVGNPVAAPAVLSADETALLQPSGATRAMRTHEQERRRRGAVYGLLAVLAILALIGVAWVLAGVFAGDDTTRVSVPDVVGQPIETARDILIERGFEIGEETFEFSEEVEEGRVIRQRPGPDSLADEGAAVDLVISQGEEVATVPDLIGLSEDEAFARLREEGLAPGQRTREHSSEVPEGRIISTDPAAGTEVPVRSRVAYVVSAGEELVTVRPVVNRSEADAIFRLEDQGLEVNVIREYSDVVAEGFVIRQDPGPGQEVPAGSTITIVVSRGPEPQPEPEPEPEPSPTEPEPSPTEPEPSPTEPEPTPTDPPDEEEGQGAGLLGGDRDT
jgi:eukaryotic-like serine/threonine-protein kinase